jgi:hypothetical protein
MTTRFAALGDSITVGMGDPVPGGLWRGFAALLSESLLGEIEFRNLATSGATTAHVAGEQLAEALPWRPHLATVVVGCNDILRGSFDIKAIGARLHPSERGHRLLAGLCHDALCDNGFPVGARPAADPSLPPPSAASRAWWMATKGTRRILRRSTDLMPQLLALAAAEWRGLSADLDHLMATEVRTVKAQW